MILVYIKRKTFSTLTNIKKESLKDFKRNEELVKGYFCKVFEACRIKPLLPKM